MQKQKVLIVEDNISMRNFLKAEVRDETMGVEVLEAGSIGDAEKLFFQNPDISVVVMDACVPGGKINTIPLVHKIREAFHFPGIMIAASSDSSFRKLLVEAGCDYDVPKELVHKKLVEVLHAA